MRYYTKTTICYNKTARGYPAYQTHKKIQKDHVTLTYIAMCKNPKFLSCDL